MTWVATGIWARGERRRYDCTRTPWCDLLSSAYRGGRSASVFLINRRWVQPQFRSSRAVAVVPAMLKSAVAAASAAGALTFALTKPYMERRASRLSAVGRGIALRTNRHAVTRA